MRERRIFPRIKTNIQTMWRAENTLDVLDRISNVSEGGVCLFTNMDNLESNGSLQLQFKLPTGDPINAKAEIQWVSPIDDKNQYAFAGLKFSDIADKCRQEIRQFVGVCRYGCA